MSGALTRSRAGNTTPVQASSAPSHAAPVALKPGPSPVIAEALYEEVQELMQQRLFESAATLAEHVVASSGGKRCPVAYTVQLATALAECKDWRRAEAHFAHACSQRVALSRGGAPEADGGGEAAEQLPGLPELKLRRAQCLLELGETADATKELEAIPLAERTALVHASLARLYKNDGQDAKARNAYESVVRLNPYAVEAHRALARLTRSRKAPAALAALQSSAAARQGPTALCAQINLGEMAVAQERPRDVLREFGALSQHYGDTCHSLASLGRAHSQQGDVASALDAYRRAADLDPWSAEGVVDYAALLAKSGERAHTVELSRLATRMLGLGNERWEAWTVGAIFCQVKSNAQTTADAQKEVLKHALSYATHGVELGPKAAAAVATKAALTVALAVKGVDPESDEQLAHDVTHQLKEAAALYRRALSLDPSIESYAGLVNLELSYLGQQQGSTVMRAFKAAKEAKDLWSESATAVVLLASVCSHDSDEMAKYLEPARTLLQNALQLEPTSTEVLSAMANYDAVNGFEADAIALLRARLRPGGNTPSHVSDALHALLGGLLVDMGDEGNYEEARRHLHEALELNPQSAAAKGALEQLDEKSAADESGAVAVDDEEEAY